MLETYQRTDLFDQAAAQAAASRGAHLDHHRGELTSVRAKLRDAQQAIDRYLAAFERGTMPEDLCGPRLTELRVQQAQLKTRERELGRLLATNTPRAPSRAMLAVFRRHIRDGLTNGNPQARKALLRTVEGVVAPTSQHANRPLVVVEGPALQV